MTGRLAVLAIVFGVGLILVRTVGWGEGNWYDLGGVLCIVLGALAIAVAGEAPEDELVAHNRRRTDHIN